MRLRTARLLPNLFRVLKVPSERLADEGGYVIVQVALMMTVLMGVVGAGVDYGLLIIENTRIQHAIDAASLAGARSLVSGNNPGTAAATTTINSYLAQYGYQNGVNNTTVNSSFSASQTGGLTDTALVTVTRLHGMFFWRAIGINQVTISKSARAVANGSMVDVMVSLDLTGSMELYSSSDLPNLRAAVVAFINQLNPDATATFGPKIGMARWAGVGCSWARGNTDSNTTWDPNVANQRGDGDAYIDLNNASGSGTGSWSEYVTPCYDDMAVLSNLTYNKAALLKLANNSGSGSCPAMPFAYPGMSNNSSLYACPLTTYDYTAPQVYGTTVTPTGMHYNNARWPYDIAPYNTWKPTVTGTKLPNAITAVSNGTYYAWATANGGRNDAFTGNYARKVLVIMTDGVNELYPSVGSPISDFSNWDSQVQSLATTLKAGPTSAQEDDVEIYVVGFFCTPYDASSSWCRSRMADTNTPHPCPNNVWNASAASPIDTLLRNISSSPAGTCTHYFPIKKSEGANLPQLFRIIAGSVARGRLSE